MPKLVSGVLALAILCAGMGFGVQYQNHQKILNNPIGGVMLVNASEVIGKTNTNIAYRIYTKDITGMSEKEIYDAKVDMLANKLGYGVEDEFTLKEGLKNGVKQNGNVIYATQRGAANLKLYNIEKPETVDKIEVSNTSDFGLSYILADDVYFTEPEENVFVFDNKNINNSLAAIGGHNVSLDGERYAQCRRIENKNAKHYSYNSYYGDKNSDFYMLELAGAEDAFEISYLFTQEFYDYLGKNPSMDLTSYDDELTVKVYFKDGNVATTILGITLSDKGKMVLNCKSYDYSKNR